MKTSVLFSENNLSAAALDRLPDKKWVDFKSVFVKVVQTKSGFSHSNNVANRKISP